MHHIRPKAPQRLRRQGVQRIKAASAQDQRVVNTSLWCFGGSSLHPKRSPGVTRGFLRVGSSRDPVARYPPPLRCFTRARCISITTTHIASTAYSTASNTEGHSGNTSTGGGVGTALSAMYQVPGKGHNSISGGVWGTTGARSAGTGTAAGPPTPASTAAPNRPPAGGPAG